MSAALLPSGEPDVGDLGIEQVIDLEAIFGRPLLDEIAAVTADLAAIEETFRPIMVRATAVSVAGEAAIKRLRFETKDVHAANAVWELLSDLGGLGRLNEVALRLGLAEAIWEPQVPGSNPVPGQFVPGTFGGES